MSILDSLRFRWKRKSDHVTFKYMRAHFMLQYLSYWIWISNVTSRKNLIYWKTNFNIACQYLDIMDEYLLFEYLLFNIHYSPCRIGHHSYASIHSDRTYVYGNGKFRLVGDLISRNIIPVAVKSSPKSSVYIRVLLPRLFHWKQLLLTF